MKFNQISQISEYQDDLIPDNQDENGFAKKEYQTSFKFDLKQIDFPKEAFKTDKIKHIALSEQSCIISTFSNKLFRFKFDTNQLQEIEIFKPEEKQASYIPVKFFVDSVKNMFVEDKKEVISIQKIFVDHHGYHAIISSTTGDNFYLGFKSNKAKFLQKLKQIQLKVIAWDDLTTEDSTQKFLFATTDGNIGMFKINLSIKATEVTIIESDVRTFNMNLDQNQTIQHLVFLNLSSQDNSKSLLIVSTDNIIFHFTGSSLEYLFLKYEQSPQLIKHQAVVLPAKQRSLMSVFRLKQDSQLKPHSLIWTNGSQLIYREMPENDQIDEFFSKQTIDQFMSQSQILIEPMIDLPIQIALSEFSYFLLYKDSLQVVSKISKETLHQFNFSKMGNFKILGMLFNKNNDILYIYTDKGFFVLDVNDQNKDAWKLYLDQKMFKEAYNICLKNQSSYTDYIGGLYADDLLKQKKSKEAALLYCKTNRSFEEVCLKLIIDDNSNAIDIYIEAFMKKNRDPLQRKILLPFLMELKVYKILQKDSNQGMKSQKDQLIQNFKQFIDNNLSELDCETVKQILLNHGQNELFQEFALKQKNYEEYIKQLIHQEKYNEAIDSLTEINKDTRQFEQQLKKLQDLIYKYNHFFMKYDTEDYIYFLKNNFEKFKLEPTKLMAGLMDIPKEYNQKAIEAIQFFIEKFQKKDKSFNNILIYLLSDQTHLKTDNEDESNNLQDNSNRNGDLMVFLRQQEYNLEKNETLKFDLDFALRIFKRFEIVEAQIRTYGMMGLFEMAVDTALSCQYQDLAKYYANKPSNTEFKKLLWNKIIRYVYEKDKKNITKIIEITNESGVLKIEDLLQLFEDDQPIEHFKEEICKSLEDYNQNIERLKEEMKGFSENSEKLKSELKSIKNQYQVIPCDQKCYECYKNVFQQEFVVFPCLHTFHKECLIKKIAQNPIEQEKYLKIQDIQSKIDQIMQKINEQKSKSQENSSGSAFLFNLINKKFVDEKSPYVVSQEEQQKLRDLKELLDMKLANECINCGKSIIESICVPYEMFHEEEKQSWDLN